MNNENLKPFNSNTAKAAGKLGGQRSGIVRKKRKELLSLVTEIMEKEPTQKEIKELSGYLDDSNPTNKALMIVSLIKSAKEGNVKAAAEVISLIEKSEAKTAEELKEKADRDNQVRIYLPWDGRGKDIPNYLEITNGSKREFLQTIFKGEELSEEEYQLLDDLEELLDLRPEELLDSLRSSAQIRTEHLVVYLLPYLNKWEIKQALRSMNKA